MNDIQQEIQSIVTQDNIFEWYGQISKHFGREPDPPFIYQLKDVFPDYQVIEVWIAFFGGSYMKWEFGHIRRVIHDLIAVYGESVRPFAILRAKEPFHAGGSAYGEEHLQGAKELCRIFCRRLLRELDMWRITGDLLLI